MRALAASLSLLAASAVAAGPPPIETPSLETQVLDGFLPPVAERLPDSPLVEPFDRRDAAPGRHGGDLRLVFSRTKDLRLIVAYSYARLVAYDEEFDLQPDILESYEVAEGGRVFTLRLRPGHRWSDGHPFTAEDFRYYWESVATNAVIYPTGPDRELQPNGVLPRFEVLDPLTVRFTWPEPNPFFLPALARSNPLVIYRPAHYLRKFHPDHTPMAQIEKRVAVERKRDWRALHFAKDRMYKNDNPHQPTLYPWRPRNAPPAERVVYERNPFYHKIDANGRQLPYVDRLLVSFADPGLIPTKVGSGDVDLHGRYLAFSDFTALKSAAERSDLAVDLWRSGQGAEIALYPNLNHKDPVWRAALNDVVFRRALSLAIHRWEINEILFFGLGFGVGDYVLPNSPLYDAEQAGRWADFDIDRANRMLDLVGYEARNADGVRLLPDGRPMEITVEHDGRSPERADALHLIAETWRKIGIVLNQKAMTRDVLKRRIKAGSTLMSADVGMNNGRPTALMPPADLAPMTPARLHWMGWGGWMETGGKLGQPIEDAAAQRLVLGVQDWARAETEDEKAQIWRDMLEIYVDQVFVIGVVSGGRRPIVRKADLRNLPREGLFNWDPGAFFGLYGLDGLWWGRDAVAAALGR
ncbi:MAG: ABC transporter substrate-binding protein [Pseudomonadota bacterium]